jgi:PhnB protein
MKVLLFIIAALMAESTRKFPKIPRELRGMTQPGMENKVMHASFRIGETLLMASDGRCDGEPRFEGFSLSIVVPDEKEAESVFNALADGGKVTMPLEKTFWAPKFGMLEDRFGVGWMVSVERKP